MSDERWTTTACRSSKYLQTKKGKVVIDTTQKLIFIVYADNPHRKVSPVLLGTAEELEENSFVEDEIYIFFKTTFIAFLKSTFLVHLKKTATESRLDFSRTWLKAQ